MLLLGAGLALRIGAIGDGELLVPANLAGHVALSLAGVFLLRFTRSVFHPEDAWAVWLERVGIEITFAVLPLLWLDRGFANEQARSILVVNGSRTLACAWSLAEVLRYRSLMLRRARLGLADAALVNRFTLWSVWMGALSVSFAFTFLLRLISLALGGAPEHSPVMLGVIRLVMGASFLVALVALQLTFFPPRAYLRRLART